MNGFTAWEGKYVFWIWTLFCVSCSLNNCERFKMNQFQVLSYFPFLIKGFKSCFKTTWISWQVYKKHQCMGENIFVLVKIVLLSKYWSGAAKPHGSIHCIWKWGKEKTASGYCNLYKYDEQNSHAQYFQLGCWYKRSSFEQSPSNPLNFLFLLQDYWLDSLWLQVCSLALQTCWHCQLRWELL